MEIFISLAAASTTPDYLYHATAPKNIKSILKRGLGSSKKLFGLFERSNYSISEKGVYLAYTPDFAADFVLGVDRSKTVVLKVKTSKLDPALLQDDLNVRHRLPVGRSFLYKGIIKPTDFEIVS